MIRKNAIALFNFYYSYKAIPFIKYMASVSHPHNTLFLFKSNVFIGFPKVGINVNTSSLFLTFSGASQGFNSNSSPLKLTVDLFFVAQCQISPAAEQLNN